MCVHWLLGGLVRALLMHVHLAGDGVHPGAEGKIDRREAISRCDGKFCKSLSLCSCKTLAGCCVHTHLRHETEQVKKVQAAGILVPEKVSEKVPEGKKIAEAKKAVPVEVDPVMEAEMLREQEQMVVRAKPYVLGIPL